MSNLKLNHAYKSPLTPLVNLSRRPSILCAAASGAAGGQPGGQPKRNNKRKPPSNKPKSLPKGPTHQATQKKKQPAPELAFAAESNAPSTGSDLEDQEIDEAELLIGEGPSAPDYSDYINFEEDPEGHRAGFVAIIGRPNAGKSTLLNALLGQNLSIVTEKAQTTRHRILGIWSEKEHQAVFLDTPGIIAERRNELEERMMGAVDQAVKDADALLAIVDASRKPEAALDMIQPGEDWKGPPMAVILNKSDLLPEEEVERLAEYFKKECNADEIIVISALERTNVDQVAKWVVKHLPEGPSLYPKDLVADASERFFVSEIIRKQVFLQYRQELPYQISVQVVEFKERRPPAKCLIRAHVIVEKDRHVGILLGAKGAAIKALSMAARKDIEEFLEREVYLDVSVKVQEGWRENAAQLERLGY